jgi:hypothetical protein
VCLSSNAKYGRTWDNGISHQNLSSAQAANLIGQMLQDVPNTSTEVVKFQSSVQFGAIGRKLANVLNSEDANVIQDRITQAPAVLGEGISASLLLNIAAGLSAHLPSPIALKELQLYLKTSLFSESNVVPFVAQLNDEDAATAAIQTIELFFAPDNSVSNYYYFYGSPAKREIVTKLGKGL